MEDDLDGSPPQSLCMIRAAELFPKAQMEKEDTQLTVPFQELAGESVKYLGRTDDGVLALSNYRIFLLKNTTCSEISVPLGLVESAQPRDLFHLLIYCKDASTVKCSFETAEQCSEWQRRIHLSVGVPETLESLFAFPFCSWTCDILANNGTSPYCGGAAGVENPPLSSVCYASETERLQRASRDEDDFMREVERLGFDLNGSWRISNANDEFKLCASYPKKILVPCCISDETLYTIANFRGSRRLPSVVWRHRKSGAVIARCSQPEVGWLGRRSSKDEQLLKALADACAFDRGERSRRLAQNSVVNHKLPSEDSLSSSPDGSHEEVALDEVRKVLIVDARSYTSAVTNRARGGGCECIEYYPCAEIEFMNLGNIHVIRRSFHALRQLCASPPDVPNWLWMLEKTMWFQHLSGLLGASMTVCHAIEKKGQPVLVHCSDGWDRTPQIVATAQLCLDPYYRTVEGFRVLVEREWLSYSHKFADRCGHGPGSDEPNERCPVFLQWLDIVHQIHKQFPCSFEFSMGYLIKLAQHSLSCLFGTFLCNTFKERLDYSVFERTFSVWPFLWGPMYRNPLYLPNREVVIWPAHNVRDLSLWSEVYLGSLGNQNCNDFLTGNADGSHGTLCTLSKTRSYGDLNTAGITQNGISRRSSDPNMTVDPILTAASSSENNSETDIPSEREDSPGITANHIFHDTRKKLQNLTIEINNHDSENFKNLQQQKNQQLANGKPVNIYEQTLKTFLPHENLITNGNSNSKNAANINNEQLSFAKTLVSSPIFSTTITTNNVSNDIGCETNATTTTTTTTTTTFLATSSTKTTNTTTTAPLTSLIGVVSVLENNETTTFASNAPPTTTSILQNSFNGFLNTLSDITTGCEYNKNNTQSNIDDQSFNNRTAETSKSNDRNEDLMHSIDLGRAQSPTSSSYGAQNLWHGSVNTSTDTLVPIENNRQEQQTTNINGIGRAETDEYDVIDAYSRPINGATVAAAYNLINGDQQQSHNSFNQNIHTNNTNCSILPKVHSRRGSYSYQQNFLTNTTTTNSSNASISSTSSSLNNLNKISNIQNISQHLNDEEDDDGINVVVTHKNATTSSLLAQTSTDTLIGGVGGGGGDGGTQLNPMDESILILPEHPKMEIFPSGNCEMLTNHATTSTANSYAYVAAANVAANYPTATAITTVQKRRRTLSSNSRRDCLNAKQAHAASNTTSRSFLPGIRSLPITPLGLPDRPQVLISCPDGLAHALSQQNIRLQQIVQEHKIREDMLLRDIDDMRTALLKKICPTCKNAALAPNDEQSYALDNVENASICSWENVEERSRTSSCASSIQPNGNSVLWVPDHAVSRCTRCQTEFWLGCRKHHCRSCGQIFCADCSEYWAPLPDEKLYSPVRLCGPCYSTRLQPQATIHYQNNTTTTSTATTSKA